MATMETMSTCQKRAKSPRALALAAVLTHAITEPRSLMIGKSVQGDTDLFLRNSHRDWSSANSNSKSSVVGSLSPSPFLTSLSPLRAGAIVSSSPTTVLPLSLTHNLGSYPETGLGHDDLTMFSDNIIDNNSVSTVDRSRHFLRASLPPSKY